MKAFARIMFPLAVTAATVAGVLEPGKGSVEERYVPAFAEAQDTVVYPHDGYKLFRRVDLGKAEIADSLLDSGAYGQEDIADTLPHLTARDTIKAPDSLKFSDPFRYKYYAALVDSATHVLVRDSLKAVSDSVAWRMLDSIYFADSAAAAKAGFDAWYMSLSRQERRKYDAEQLMIVKMAEADSIREAKEEKKAIRDSIIETTPRILETFAVPDSMQYKRIISWTTDPDFHKMDIHEPDTAFNHHFHDDAPWMRKDVNVSWLGMSGSAVQYYNYFNRKSDEEVDFYDAYEPWTVSPRTMKHYNTKTPYTELAYYGTLVSTRTKESDNLHIFTTQNILPSLNVNFLFDRFGGGGFLENEETKNSTVAIGANWLGKKYLAHAGFISNTVSRGENGGVRDNMWIRDTLVDSREIAVALKKAQSKVTKRTVFLEQQLRIPFNFINDIKARRDTNFRFNADTLDRDITTAFIGHSSEYSVYTRKYADNLSEDPFISEFYNDTFNWGNSSMDSLGVRKLDNKLFIRLQPWAADGIVSKLDIGVGDVMRHYFDSTSVRPMTHKENSVYMYAGVEGRWNKYLDWDAKGRFVFAGAEAGDFGIEANARVNFYPFRRAKKSPLSLSAHFETSLKEPNYYQKQMMLNHFSWTNDFSKTSTTKIEGRVSIPHWKLDASAGYALLGNNIYYDTLGIVRQNTQAMSILSAYLRKEFALGPFHMDNRALLQFSSNQEVIPLPLLSLNARWYFQFVVQRDETKTNKVMEMQVGIDAHYNTQWHSPAWNPELGVFHNQNVNLYENGPYFDVFVNVQWKRAVIFIKYLNAGRGWPMRKRDYFSADHYVMTQGGGFNGLQLGIYWPFYIQPGKASSNSGTSHTH